jgi:hypothetical protein
MCEANRSFTPHRRRVYLDEMSFVKQTFLEEEIPLSSITGALFDQVPVAILLPDNALRVVS